MNQSVLILDCGATNVKACLVNTEGKIISSHSLPNETAEDPYYKEGLIWDIDSIWNKLAICSRKACSETKDTEIVAVTVTTFGVDGAAVKKDGSLSYPVISWQCSRTEAVEKKISNYFDPDWLYKKTGLQSYHFNTLYKLIWLRENRPDILDKADYYLMMPSLIIQRLTGEFITDTTMAGTSMLTDNRSRSFSDEILRPLGLDASLFPALTEPGTIVGKVNQSAADALGINPGVAVTASGHDTQFAILGSGAGENQPVLSSGTWEILMVRALSASLSLPERNAGVTVEFDSEPGLVNIGVQWVASGVLEWIGKMFYPGLSGSSLHSAMIQEADLIPAGSDGVIIVPELFSGGFSGKKGSIVGFKHETTRAHFYRASLEALSYYTLHGLEMLQQAGNYKAESVICVGGGSRNALWNQIRADVLGIPVKVLDMKETTALGAAITAFTGIGVYSSFKEGIRSVNNTFREYYPGKHQEEYSQRYKDFAAGVF